MKASIVITTRNRAEDVCRAVQSCFMQDCESLEVLVYDDASTDDTANLLRRRFPEVIVCQGQQRRGYIALRNAGFRDARGEFVFSLDDDAYFTDASTVSATIDLFRQLPTAAAIALPYIEPSTVDPGRLMRRVPEDCKLRNFVGCAHAIRRDVALQLGGYREFFVHQGEERDLGIRLLDAGYEIVLGTTPPIVHSFSPKRDSTRISSYGIRNTLLFDWLNTPAPYVAGRLGINAINLLRYKITVRTFFPRLIQVARGFVACLRYVGHRKPVRRATYHRFRQLPAHGPLPQKQAEVLDIPAVRTTAN